MGNSVKCLAEIEQGNIYIRIPLSEVVDTGFLSVDRMACAAIGFKTELQVATSLKSAQISGGEHSQTNERGLHTK